MADKNLRSEIRSLNVEEIDAVSGGAKNYRDPQNRPWAVFDLDTGKIGAVGCGGITVVGGHVYIGGYNGPIRMN